MRDFPAAVETPAFVKGLQQGRVKYLFIKPECQGHSASLFACHREQAVTLKGPEAATQS